MIRPKTRINFTISVRANDLEDLLVALLDDVDDVVERRLPVLENLLEPDAGVPLLNLRQRRLALLNL